MRYCKRSSPNLWKMCLKWLLKKIFRKVVHNKCIYVHDKIISYKTLYKNQQAMYKIISLSLWQQILATTISNHNTCDRSSNHGRACSGTPQGQLRETGLCIPISLYYISMLASSANIPDNKVSKYYCQYLSPEGCAFISWNPRTETPDNSSFPPPYDERTHHYPDNPQINICPWWCVLGQSLVCPFWL